MPGSFRFQRGRLVTIGSFDGVHRGHQALLERTASEAAKRRLRPMALTFRVPPRVILDPRNVTPLLSDPVEKETLLRSYGMADVKFLNFDTKIAQIRPFLFFRDILIREQGAKGIVVGADFRFGLDRSAGAIELVRWGNEFEIPVWVISPVKSDAEVVSSTVLRRLMAEGRIKRALNLLGHGYLIHGKVMRGQRLGRKLGFATANLKTAEGKLLPRGVYAVRGCFLSGNSVPKWPPKKVFYGVCNIGTRPTVGASKQIACEVHIFGESRDLYGRTLMIELSTRLRNERRFDSLPALKRAIGQDVKHAQRFWNKKVKKTSRK